MSLKKSYLLVIFVLLFMLPFAWADPAINKKNMMRKSGPIEVVADRMEAFQEKRIIVFSGNTVATQGDIKLKTDRLSIYYKKSGEQKDKIGKQDMAVAGDLEKIELQGNVIVTQNDISATSETAVYYQDGAKVIMTGNPVLQQGKNVIKGCRVVIFIDENRGEVQKCETGSTGRVTAIIHPQEKK